MVPRNCTLRFYSENLRGLTTGFILNALMSPDKDDLPGGGPDTELSEFKSCPDYILSPDPTSYHRSIIAHKWGSLASGDYQQLTSEICMPPKKPVSLAGLMEWYATKKMPESRARGEMIDGYDFHWLTCRVGLRSTGSHLMAHVNRGQINRELAYDDLCIINISTDPALNPMMMP